MPTAVGRKYLGPTFQHGVETLRSVYDFSVDGGATGTYDLMEASADIVVTKVHAYVRTAVTSAGAATVEIGYTGDTDAIVTAKLQAALTIGAHLPEDGAATESFKIASGNKISLTIAVAALTAGKIEVMVQYVKA